MIQPHESLGDDTGLIQPVVQETGSNTEVVVPDTTTGEQAGAVLDLAGAEFDLTKLPTVSSGFNTTKVGLGAFFADIDAEATEPIGGADGTVDSTGADDQTKTGLDDLLGLNLLGFNKTNREPKDFPTLVGWMKGNIHFQILQGLA